MSQQLSNFSITNSYCNFDDLDNESNNELNKAFIFYDDKSMISSVGSKDHILKALDQDDQMSIFSEIKMDNYQYLNDEISSGDEQFIRGFQQFLKKDIDQNINLVKHTKKSLPNKFSFTKSKDSTTFPYNSSMHIKKNHFNNKYLQQYNNQTFTKQCSLYQQPGQSIQIQKSLVQTQTQKSCLLSNKMNDFYCGIEEEEEIKIVDKKKRIKKNNHHKIKAK